MDLQEKMETSEENSVVDETPPLPPVSSQTDQSERKDFTSEIFKIEIKNLAKFGFGVRNHRLIDSQEFVVC